MNIDPAGHIQPTKAVALDISGVLHTREEFGYFLPRCVKQLNRIIGETDAKVFLTSSWRNYIIDGSMTLMGFWIMLQTHGIHCELIGHTASDEDIPDRAIQIKCFLASRPEIKRVCVLDDMAMFRDCQVLVDGRVGLTKEDADKAIEILNGEQK